MRKTNRSTRYLLVIVSALLMLTISACGPSNADATPTMSVDEIYTAAFKTLSAQQATQLALTPPTPYTLADSATDCSTPHTRCDTALGTAPTLAGGGAQLCDNCVFVSDVTIPDGTVMTPGQTFTKTWALMNNGTCAWSTSYKLSFISGEAMGGTSVPVPSAVPAGQQAQISVSLIAPATGGSYTGTWRCKMPRVNTSEMPSQSSSRYLVAGLQQPIPPAATSTP